MRLNGHVGDATLCALATHCSDTLTSVDFERCSITDAGLASLSACSKLINVTLASCGCFSDRGLEQLVHNCHRLRSCIVRDCARVQGGFVTTARSTLPHCVCKFEAPRRARLQKAAMQSAAMQSAVSRGRARALVHIAPVILAPPQMPE